MGKKTRAEKRQERKEEKEAQLKAKRQRQFIGLLVALVLWVASVAVFVVAMLYSFVPSMTLSVQGDSPLSVIRWLFLGASAGLLVSTLMAAFCANGKVWLGRLMMGLGVILFFLSFGFTIIGWLFYTVLPNFASFA